MQNNCAVVIHMYKTALSNYEEIALKQALSVLSEHPIVVIAPKGLSIDQSKFNGVNVKTLFFNEDYFSSIEGYNRLLRSIEFYERLSDYSYILIHQLDAFVFSDQLSYWCSLGYDYIGAPWIKELSNDKYLHPYLPFLHRYKLLRYLRPFIGNRYMVGNGGFSLRKISTAIDVIRKYDNEIKKFEKDSQYWLTLGATSTYEDLFWCFVVPSLWKNFKIAPSNTALKFAFETAPAACLKMNDNKLPFGCHAWYKEDIVFWRGIFKEYGYNI